MFIAVNQVNRVIIVVVVIVFMMVNNRLKSFDRFKKEIKIIAFRHKQFRDIPAAQAVIIKNIMAERK